jgi:hypothetical protein
MLTNYKINQDGAIEQINKEKFIYDNSYANRYAIFNTKSIENLRLGYIIGSIGKIPDSVMDIGYGNADFLNHCKNFINKLYGNDVEPAFPLPEGIEFVKNIKDKEVELITFFDCLEHFHDIEFVKDLKCKYIVISLPWCTKGNDDNWFQNWKHRKPNEHIYHFNEISLEKFMKRQGFSMVNYCNLEDKIRKDNSLSPNILTATFKKDVY